MEFRETLEASKSKSLILWVSDWTRFWPIFNSKFLPIFNRMIQVKVTSRFLGLLDSDYVLGPGPTDSTGWTEPSFKTLI